jgi:hypothetical protein
MIKKTIFLALFSLMLPCHAQKADSGPSVGERLHSAFEKAAKAVGATKEYGTPRKVARGAQPEIVLKDGTIRFNGRPLVFGRPLAEWREIIGKGDVCSPKSELPAWCKWDALGIEIVGSINRPLEVMVLNVRFNRDPEEGLYDLRAHDASGKPIDPVWLSKGIYPGFLEFDGFGIDRRTQFWEIRMSVDRQHGLRCGLRDCHMPFGLFAPSTNIHMVLTTNDEYGSLRELAITLKDNKM